MVTRAHKLLVGILLLSSAGAEAEVLTLSAEAPLTYLSLDGPVSLAGMAPLPLAELPVGEYRLTAEAPGYLAARGRLRRAAGGLTGASWAGNWALLKPPGWVYLQREEERGWFWMGAAVTSLAMTGVLQAWVQDAEDDLTRAEGIYAAATSELAIAAARDGVRAAARERDDHREVRRLWIGYCAAVWLGAGLEASLLTPRPTLQHTGAGAYRLQAPTSGTLGTMLRSALVPGAGQRALGRERWGNFFLAGTALLTAATLAAHDALLEAQRDQARAQDRFAVTEAETELAAARAELEACAERVDDRETLRWAFLGAAASLYAWNVIDAWSGDHARKDSQLAWSLAPTREGVLICASWSF